MRRTFFIITFLSVLTSLCLADSQKKANIDPEKGQVWWGYFIDDNNYGDIGADRQQHYSCAIRIPHDNKVARGKTIHAVRMWFNNNITSDNLDNLRIWISDTLPCVAKEASICFDDVTYRKGGVVDGAFTTPYTMADKDVYVGFSFTIYDLGTTSAAQEACGHPVQTTTGLPDIDDAFYLKYWPANPQNHHWLDRDSLVTAGNLAMNVLLGDDIYSNAAGVKVDTEEIVARGTTASIPVTIENLGSAPVQTLAYTTIVDDIESDENTIDISESPINSYHGTKSVSISVPASLSVGRSSYKVKITKVNNVDNETLAEDGTVSSTLLTVAQASPRKTYIENYVKCTDGFAPFAYVSDDSLRRMHPEYIGVIIHDNDAMQTGLRESVCYSLPANWFYAHVNRQGEASDVYAYYGSQYNDPISRRTKFGIEDDYQAAQKKVTEAGLKLSAEWSDESKVSVNIKTDVTFQYDSNVGGYSLGYVLCEDQMSGTSSDWEQTNNVLPTLKDSHIFDWDPVMTNRYVNGSNPVTDMKYNNVLVAAKGLDCGISGSLPSSFKTGVPVSYSCTFPLSEAKIDIQDKEYLTLTALLFNTNTGKVVNAERVFLGEGYLGIKNTTAETTTPTPAFDLQGRRVSAAYKGLRILNGKKLVAP